MVLGLALAGAAAGIEAPAPAATPAPPAAEPPATAAAEPPSGGNPALAEPPINPRELGPCELVEDPDEQAIDKARLGLWKTACRAALWFDGLFGEDRHPKAAANTAGRVETSYLHSSFEGSKIRTRFNVRFRFPNLNDKFEAFAGRDQSFVTDRIEGFGLRSQFLDISDEDLWIAGIGYRLPGSYRQRTDFRVGASGGRTPEVFVQGRHRRNWYVGERDLWHFRETLFWTNRDGFGSTTGLDFDHLLSRSLLLRWGNIGTYSEITHGLDWRSAWVLYDDLSSHSALGYEVFIRGETDAEIPLHEYGARTVYRHTILHRDWLWGEADLGYTWPQLHRDEPRQGSTEIGVGIELLFGGSDMEP